MVIEVCYITKHKFLWDYIRWGEIIYDMEFPNEAQPRMNVQNWKTLHLPDCIFLPLEVDKIDMSIHDKFYKEYPEFLL